MLREVAAVAAVLKAGHGGEVSLGEPQDLSYGDLGSGLREGIASLGAALCLNQSSVLEHGDDLLGIFLCDVLSTGNVLEPQRAVYGQISHQSQCVA